jgi:hypothetical protein
VQVVSIHLVGQTVAIAVGKRGLKDIGLAIAIGIDRVAYLRANFGAIVFAVAIAIGSQRVAMQVFFLRGGQAIAVAIAAWR